MNGGNEKCHARDVKRVEKERRGKNNETVTDNTIDTGPAAIGLRG